MISVMPVLFYIHLAEMEDARRFACLLVYPCRNSARQLAAPNVSASAVSAEKVLKL